MSRLSRVFQVDSQLGGDDERPRRSARPQPLLEPSQRMDPAPARLAGELHRAARPLPALPPPRHALRHRQRPRRDRRRPGDRPPAGRLHLRGGHRRLPRRRLRDPLPGARHRRGAAPRDPAPTRRPLRAARLLPGAAHRSLRRPPALPGQRPPHPRPRREAPGAVQALRGAQRHPRRAQQRGRAGGVRRPHPRGALRPRRAPPPRPPRPGALDQALHRRQRRPRRLLPGDHLDRDAGGGHRRGVPRPPARRRPPPRGRAGLDPAAEPESLRHRRPRLPPPLRRPARAAPRSLCHPASRPRRRRAQGGAPGLVLRPPAPGTAAGRRGADAHRSRREPDPRGLRTRHPGPRPAG
jgi:hypothetical protein